MSDEPKVIDPFEDHEHSPAGAERAAHNAEQKAIDQIREYATPIVIGVGLALMVYFGLMAVRHNREQRIARAAELFSQADTTEELEQLIRDFSGSPVAPLARLRLASQKFNNGSYEEALAQYQQFIIENPAHMLSQAAKLGEAYCLEAMGRVEESMQAYQDFQATYGEHYLKPMAVFGEARSLEQMGQLDQAREVYQNFILNNPDSDWIVHAESAMKFLDMQRRAVNG